MPPFEGLKNAYHSRAERNPEEFSELVSRTENGELDAYRAIWAGGGGHEDTLLFVPSGQSVAKALRAYEELADENYYSVPISAEAARERLVTAEKRREEARIKREAELAEKARIKAERDAPIDVNGYADFLKAEHRRKQERPGITRRLLGRLMLVR